MKKVIGILLITFILNLPVIGWLSIKKEKTDIEHIGKELISNELIYSGLKDGSLNLYSALKELNMDKDYWYYVNHAGIHNGREGSIYFLYYSGYERTIAYYPEFDCWRGLHGAYKIYIRNKCDF